MLCLLCFCYRNLFIAAGNAVWRHSGRLDRGEFVLRRIDWTNQRQVRVLVTNQQQVPPTSFIQNWTSFVSCGWRPFIQRYTFQVAVVLQLTRLLHYIIITKNPSTSIMRTKFFTDKKNDCFFPVTGVTFSHILLSCREMNNFNLFCREGLIFSITLSFCQYKLTLSSMATWLACWASVVCRWVL